MLSIIESDSPAEGAADIIQSGFEQYAGLPVLFLSAGGSALSVLAHLPIPSNATFLTISATDERFTDDASGRNFPAILDTSFGKGALVAGAEPMDPLMVGTSLTDAAEMWEAMLMRWRDRNPEGAVIALMGIGPDGHIAGIFGESMNENAYQETFSEGGWVSGYEVGSPHAATSGFLKRITTTFSFMAQEIDLAVVYAVGEAKCDILRKIAWGIGARYEYPAAAIHDLPQATLVTDCKVMKE